MFTVLKLDKKNSCLPPDTSIDLVEFSRNKNMKYANLKMNNFKNKI